jgi:putative tricarboxylic transport membrane protein
MSIFVAAAGGILLGMVAGLVPGVGMTTIVMSMYLVLLSFDVGQILIFYFCLLAASQYFGSIPAIFLGVAGESSSNPAVTEGHVLARLGLGAEAIWFTGISSFVGSMIGLGFLLAASALLGNRMALGTGTTLLIMLVIGVLVCVTTTNGWKTNLLLTTAAVIFAHVGVSNSSSIPHINFGLPWLSSGVSYIALSAALISVKEVILTASTDHSAISYRAIKFRTLLTGSLKYRWSMLRGGLIGAVGGLVPGLTTVASSHYAYTVEKLISKNYNKGHMPALISSEGANNSGAITMLLPLLMFGVPITLSEAIIFGILDAKSWSFTAAMPLQLFLNHWYIMIAANIVSLILAIKFAPHLVKFFPKNKNTLSAVVFAILLVMVYLAGDWNHGSGIFNVVTFLIACAVAIATPRVNYLPFIFWLVIGNVMIETFYRYLQLIGLL